MWDCKNIVWSMVFDTTNSNTGAITAACVSIQERLNKELLWLACRHHIGEIILTHSWESLKVETSKSPEIQIFQRLKLHFEKLYYKDMENMFIPPTPPNLTEEIANIVILCEEALGFPRGDYKELVLLTLAYLNAAPEGFHLQRPGALHKARWMARLIYSIKIVLIQADK